MHGVLILLEYICEGKKTKGMFPPAFLCTKEINLMSLADDMDFGWAISQASELLIRRVMSSGISKTDTRFPKLVLVTNSLYD